MLFLIVELLADKFVELFADGIRPEDPRELFHGQCVDELALAELLRVKNFESSLDKASVCGKPESDEGLGQLLKFNPAGAVIIHDLEELLGE